MTEDKTQFGQISPVMTGFVEHLLLSLFEEFDGLFAFCVQVLNKDPKVFVIIQ